MPTLILNIVSRTKKVKQYIKEKATSKTESLFLFTIISTSNYLTLGVTTIFLNSIGP